ncbi:MAG TPA: SMP-30/gluconolactonase/LRE family protein [Polyangia bacterium]|jgi:gluconolactonase
MFIARRSPPVRWRGLAIAVLLHAFGCAHPAPSAAPSTAAAAAGAASVPALAGAGPARKLASPFPFESLEGPYWVAAGGYLLFSDVVEQNGPGAKIYRYTPATNTFAVEPYPGPPASTNGLGSDASGNLLACERWNGVVARVAAGVRTVLADHYPAQNGASLNAPNDIVTRADGNIYFTDTKWGARPGPHAPHAVYRIAPGGALSVAFAVSMPNGVALSPDGATLYVGSDDQNVVWRLPLDGAGAAGAATVIVDAARVPGGLFHVPDGICVDDSGAFYVPNNSDAVKAIQVFAPDGRYLGGIPIPDRPSNCSFGGADRRTLFVTTLHAIYAVDAATPGLP